MRFEDIEQKVISWGRDRGILPRGSEPGDQVRKLAEEFDELDKAIREGNQRDAIDAIGDMIVVLTMIAELIDTDLFTCYAAAYLQIKDRKGKMVNGVFVKEQ